MSTKRKRPTEVVKDTSPAASPSTAKRRKGRLTNAEKEQREIDIAKGEYVLSKIRKQRSSNGESIIMRFLRVPSRRAEPEFYEAIEDPIDFTSIQQKLKNPEYMTFEEFCSDIDSLVKNSTSYYKEDSEEYVDAKQIQEIFEAAKEKVESGEYLNDEVEEEEDEEDKEEQIEEKIEEEEGEELEDDSSSEFEIDLYMFHDMLGAILEYTDSTGRLLCPPFRVLQSKEEFPLYYDKIKNPIDLKTIAKKGREDQYKSLSALKKDLYLLFSNAQEFSGKDSEIYKDATELKKFVREKAEKIEEKGSHPKRRQKTQLLVDALLAQTSAGDDHYSEDSEEDEDTENDSNPLWKLYWTIRNARHEKDRTQTLADPFLELPSKTCYPDYFDEIETPISLFMINKRLKTKGYDIKGLVKDLMQMYSNAFEYNLESSDVYMSAEKLRRLTLSTAKNLCPSIDFLEFERKPTISAAATPLVKSPPKHRKIKMEMIDSESEDSRTPPPKRKSPKKTKENGGFSSGRGRKTHLEVNDFMRNRQMMMHLWTTIHQYKIDPLDNYWPSGAFMKLPSAKQYPEYYQIIQNPVDMTMIRERIDSNKYQVVEQMVNDVRRMFANARDFNEPKSNIHQDAIRLETILLRTYEGMRNVPFNPTFIDGTPQNRIRMINMSSASQGSPKIERRGRKPKQEPEQREQRRPEDSFSHLPEEEQKMYRLFLSIQHFRDETGRLLSVHFLKLPTRDEFPAYYETIKKPMDMMRIHHKLKSKAYLRLYDIVADFRLMLGNACKFNEPGSDIYKDAVSLQKVLLELKQDMSQGEKIPLVQVELRTIFTSIFASIFNKKDENGKCYSDNLTELVEILKNKGAPMTEWPFTFDQIKINIDKCRYRRLDRFQKDFFDLFDKARQMSKTDSPMYQAATILQKAFILERDARCKGVITSNAYIVIEKDVDESIRVETHRKMKEEAKEENEGEEGSSAAPIKRNESEVEIDEIEVEGVQYNAPCYAYISRTDEKKTPLHILRIERIFKNENGDQAIEGLWVYRPDETLHLANRKFLKREVFLTPFRDTVLVDRLRGKCLVVGYQTFVGQKINAGFEEEDIYVCEFKYSGKPKYFTKFKWPYMAEDEELECEERSKLLSPKRTVKKNDSEENDEKSVDDSDEDDDDRAKSEFVLDIDRYETPAVSNGEPEPGRTYFHQIRSNTGKFFSRGQFVLVFNAKKPLCDVMRINKLWRDDDGVEWFSGSRFARPVETIHDKGRMFYENEVIAIIQNDETRRLSEIQIVCDVMHPKTYVKERQTDVAECDVFVCESAIHGSTEPPTECSLYATPTNEDYDFTVAEPMNLDYSAKARKFKTYKLPNSIANEEYFVFKTPINMEQEMSPFLKNEGAMPLDHLDEMMDDDTDGSESVASSMINNSKTDISSSPSSSLQLPATPTRPMTQVVTVVSSSAASAAAVAALAPTPKTIKSKSGYILFSAEVRKRIMHENPDAGFGEVSKIVGIEWKKLSEEQKKQYEVRAEIVAQEKAKLDAIKAAQERTLQPGQIRIFQCKWANCDSQFDVEEGLYEHIIQHHTSQIIMDSDQQFVCMWVTCLRNRKDGKPFPSLPRLHRHMKEKHMSTSVRNVYQNQIGKNYFKSVPIGDPPVNTLVNAPYGRIPPPQPVAPPQQQQHQQQQHQQQHMQHQQIPNQQMQQINGINGHHQPQYGNQVNGQMMQHPQQQQMQVNGDPHHQQHYQGGPQPQQHQIQYPGQIQQNQQSGYPQGPSSSQQFQHPQQGQQQNMAPPQPQQPMVLADPGRTVVRSFVPTFVPPPNSIHSRRVLHSEAYLKYIESLSSNRQKSVSRWERSIGATHRNTQPTVQNGQIRLPVHWIKKTHNGQPVAREEDVSKALWKLREQLLESTCNFRVNRQPL